MKKYEVLPVALHSLNGELKALNITF